MASHHSSLSLEARFDVKVEKSNEVVRKVVNYGLSNRSEGRQRILSLHLNGNQWCITFKGEHGEVTKPLVSFTDQENMVASICF